MKKPKTKYPIPVLLLVLCLCGLQMAAQPGGPPGPPGGGGPPITPINMFLGAALAAGAWFGIKKLKKGSKK